VARILPLLLALLSLAFAPAPFPKKARPARVTDFDKLQGTWIREAVYVNRKGAWLRRVKAPVVDTIIGGNRVAWGDTFVQPIADESFSLCAGIAARAIDFTSEQTPGVERGVYHLDGDTLTLVLPPRGEARPKSLNDGTVKVVFRRKR
jgi:uncharacterized protein (TIGR03067 family)